MRARCAAAFIFLSFLVLCPATLLAAAGGEGGSWGWIETVGRWVNLVILFGGIFYFVRKPAARFFARRRLEIQNSIAEAAEVSEKAQAELARIRARVDSLEHELASIQAESAREAEEERGRILEQAAHESDRIVSQARREIDGLSRSARKDLRSYAAELAVKLAEGNLKKRIGREQQKRLTDRFVSGLEDRTEKSG